MTRTAAAADVLREHYGSLWCPTCGPSTRTREAGPQWNVAQHQAAMLAAAGLLSTSEHEAEMLDRKDNAK